MMVGYATDNAPGTFRLINLQTNRIIKSRNIKWLDVTYGEYMKNKIKNDDVESFSNHSDTDTDNSSNEGASDNDSDNDNDSSPQSTNSTTNSSTNSTRNPTKNSKMAIPTSSSTRSKSTITDIRKIQASFAVIR